MTFVDPKNDVAFRRIFGQDNRKDILISFLNSILHGNDSQKIIDIDLLNPHQVPHLKDTKETILDVRCRDQNGAEYISEMQVLPEDFFDQRVLYYVSRAYANQLGKGENYRHLKPVYFIGLLNFNFCDNPHYLSTHRIYDVETNQNKLADFHFTFIELPKFLKTESALQTPLDQWLYFFKQAAELSAIPAVIQEKPIRDAFEIANEMHWTPDELIAYENSFMQVHREINRVSYGFNEGLEKGEETGFSKGEKVGFSKGEGVGFSKGISKGEKRQCVEIAKKMLLAQQDISFIVKITGISLVELQAIQHELVDGQV